MKHTVNLKRGFVTNSRWRCVFFQFACISFPLIVACKLFMSFCLSSPCASGYFRIQDGGDGIHQIIHIEENSETNLTTSHHKRLCFLSAIVWQPWLNLRGTRLYLKHEWELSESLLGMKYGNSRKICGFSSICIIYQGEGVAWVNEAKDLCLIGFC